MTLARLSLSRCCSLWPARMSMFCLADINSDMLHDSILFYLDKSIFIGRQDNVLCAALQKLNSPGEMTCWNSSSWIRDPSAVWPCSLGARNSNMCSLQDFLNSYWSHAKFCLLGKTMSFVLPHGRQIFLTREHIESQVPPFYLIALPFPIRGDVTNLYPYFDRFARSTEWLSFCVALDILCVPQVILEQRSWYRHSFLVE